MGFDNNISLTERITEVDEQLTWEARRSSDQFCDCWAPSVEEIQLGHTPNTTHTSRPEWTAAGTDKVQNHWKWNN